MLTACIRNQNEWARKVSPRPVVELVAAMIQMIRTESSLIISHVFFPSLRIWFLWFQCMYVSTCMYIHSGGNYCGVELEQKLACLHLIISLLWSVSFLSFWRMNRCSLRCQEILTLAANAVKSLTAHKNLVHLLSTSRFHGLICFTYKESFQCHVFLHPRTVLEIFFSIPKSSFSLRDFRRRRPCYSKKTKNPPLPNHLSQNDSHPTNLSFPKYKFNKNINVTLNPNPIKPGRKSLVQDFYGTSPFSISISFSFSFFGGG